MTHHAPFFVSRSIGIKMLDSLSVEIRRTTDDSMDGISLLD